MGLVDTYKRKRCLTQSVFITFLGMFELLNRKTIVLCCLLFVSCGFINFSLSDANQVGFSDFGFLYNWTESSSLTLYLSGWVETWFYFKIYNKELFSVSYRLWFVDGYTTVDGKRACKSDNETSDFGQYIFWDTTAQTIWASSSGITYLTWSFPESYSWLYMGCVMYYPVIASWDTYLNTVPRRGWFIDVYVTPVTTDFTLTVRPTFRPSWGNTWYSITEADFRLFTYENSVWTQLYNSAKNPSANPKINIGKHGTGIVSFIPPVSGTLYLLALKGSGTLSLWYTGIRNDNITWFNFFSWALADSLDNEFMFKYYAWWITGNYLKVWDTTADTTWNYDWIKDSDFTLMTNKLTLSSAITHPYRFDLDLNNVINALEQTMLLDSYDRVWFITIQNHLPLTDFLSF